MLDELRNDADFQEEEAQPEEVTPAQQRPVRRAKQRGPFLGMTPQQRFVERMRAHDGNDFTRIC